MSTALDTEQEAAIGEAARLIERALSSPNLRQLPCRERRTRRRALAAGLRSARRGLKGRDYSGAHLEAAYRIALELLPPSIDAWDTI